MRLTITAPILNAPTHSTLEEYAKAKFEKLKKFMHEKDSEDHEVHVSVKKSHDIYELTAEVFTPEHVAVHSKERDLKKAVDMAKDQMLRRLRKNKDKRITLKRNR